METKVKQELLLTEEETDEIIKRAKGSLNAVAVYIRQAQLAKDEARFKKERELIRKDEKERILAVGKELVKAFRVDAHIFLERLEQALKSS